MSDRIVLIFFNIMKSLSADPLLESDFKMGIDCGEPVLLTEYEYLDSDVKLNVVSSGDGIYITAECNSGIHTSAREDIAS